MSYFEQLKDGMISWLVIIMCSALTFWACGEDDLPPAAWSVSAGTGDDIDFGRDQTVIVTSDGNYIVTGNPGEECVVVEDDCIDLSEARGQYCNDPNAQADIVVVDGEVVEIICYPSREEATSIEEVAVLEGDQIEIPQTENGAVITFSKDTDGVPIEGDVVISSERTTLFGNGKDNTIIDGNLTVSSNHARVRGLTITGDVLITQNSNNISISFCRIYGNLTINSNDSIVLNCEVFGDVIVTGNNNYLINLGIGGEWSLGTRTDCENVWSFDDLNQDYRVTADEVGEAIDCSGAGPINPGR